MGGSAHACVTSVSGVGWASTRKLPSVISWARAGTSAMISRVLIPQRRALEVLLTADGQKLAGRLRAQVDRSLSPLTDSLTTTEQYRLQTLLRQMLGSDQRDAGLPTSGPPSAVSPAMGGVPLQRLPTVCIRSDASMMQW